MSVYMGRVKTQQVKRAAEMLFNSEESRFSSDFSKNKEIVEEIADVPSKKLRNVIAGYVTRLARK